MSFGISIPEKSGFSINFSLKSSISGENADLEVEVNVFLGPLRSEEELFVFGLRISPLFLVFDFSIFELLK